MWYQDVWGWVSGIIGLLGLGLASVTLFWSIYAWKHTWAELTRERELREQLLSVDLTKEYSFARLCQLSSELLELDPDMKNPFEAEYQKYKKKYPDAATSKLNPSVIKWLLFNLTQYIKQHEKPEDK